MGFVRFSIARLVGAVGLCGLGLACLLQASTPWAAATFSVTIALSTLGLVGVACRRGERRAFWAGFATCGWVYLILTTGPWFKDMISPRLVTTQLLDWAYPWLIPEERQPSGSRSLIRAFPVQGPILGASLA